MRVQRGSQYIGFYGTFAGTDEIQRNSRENAAGGERDSSVPLY